MPGQIDMLERIVEELRDIKRRLARVETLEFTQGGGASGASSFTGLSDTPANYTGAASQLVAVNDTPDGLEFRGTLPAAVESSIDHGNLTNTHNLTTDVDHGSISGLADDDHTQYALLAGRAGGQDLTGGTGSGDPLTLRGSSHATSGGVAVDDDLAVDGKAYFVGQLDVESDNVGQPALIARGAAGQTAPVVRSENSTGSRFWQLNANQDVVHHNVYRRITFDLPDIAEAQTIILDMADNASITQAAVTALVVIHLGSAIGNRHCFRAEWVTFSRTTGVGVVRGTNVVHTVIENVTFTGPTPEGAGIRHTISPNSGGSNAFIASRNGITVQLFGGRAANITVSLSIS